MHSLVVAFRFARKDRLRRPWFDCRLRRARCGRRRQDFASPAFGAARLRRSWPRLSVWSQGWKSLCS